jgi:hypothetical protein
MPAADEYGHSVEAYFELSDLGGRWIDCHGFLAKQSAVLSTSAAPVGSTLLPCNIGRLFRSFDCVGLFLPRETFRHRSRIFRFMVGILGTSSGFGHGAHSFCSINNASNRV